MEVPDALSRRTHTVTEIQDLLRFHEHDLDDDKFEISITDSEGKPMKILFRLNKSTKADKPQTKLDPKDFNYEDDKEYQYIYRKLKKGDKDLPSLDLYYIKDNLLYFVDHRLNHRICVPRHARSSILYEYHDTPLGAHLGAAKVYANIKQKFIWPNMKTFVESYVTTCDACQKNKSWHKKPYGKPNIQNVPVYPWDEVSIDFCGPFPKTKEGFDMILAITDNLTKMIHLIPCSSKATAKDTARLFIEHCMRYHGIPNKIISDRGPQFEATFWEHLWKYIDSQAARTSPYHPQSNSLIERQNKTFEESLRCFVNARQDNWDKCLIFYEFAYNNSTNPSTGQTPFFLNYGHHPKLPISSSFPTPNPAVADFVQHMETTIAQAQDTIRQNQIKRADRQFPKFQPPTFQAGDKVLLSTENLNLQLPSKKLAPRWIGPLTILQLRGPTAVILQIPPRLQRLSPLQNVCYLRKYTARPPEIGPTTVQAPPDLVDGNEEFEVEDIIAHRLVNRRTQYLVRFTSYDVDDDLWLPAENLKNAPEIVQAYHDRQRDKVAPPPTTSQKALRPRRPRVPH